MFTAAGSVETAAGIEATVTGVRVVVTTAQVATELEGAMVESVAVLARGGLAL